MSGGGPSETGAQTPEQPIEQIQTPEQLEAKRKLAESSAKRAEELRAAGNSFGLTEQEMAKVLLANQLETIAPTSAPKPNNGPTATPEATKVAVAQVQATVANAIPKTEGLTKEDLGKALKNITDMIPQGLKNFFKAIFGPLLGLGNSAPEAAKDLSKILPKDGKAILDKYGVKIGDGKISGTTELQFDSAAKITGSKKTEAPKVGADGKPTSTIESQTTAITNADGKIILNKESTVTSITEKDNGDVVIVAKNKDGTIDTYMVANAKKIEALNTVTV